MKKTIRLTESDLIKIVHRVIKEQETDESAFTFGDKVKNKLGKLVGIPEKTDDEERLADDIMSKVESGDYNMLRDEFGDSNHGSYKIRVILHNEPYSVSVTKHTKIGSGFPYGGSETKVETPDGHTVYLPKGFSNKLISVIKSDDKGQRFRYPKNR